MTDKLDARVLIVGGTGGIGRALAVRYASLGSDVLITSRDAGRAAAAAAEIGPNVRGIALDIAEPEKIAGMLADVGRIDRLLIVAIERDSNTVRNYDIAKARRAVGLSQGEDAEAQAALAQALAASGDASGAAEAWKRAGEIDPQNAEVQKHLKTKKGGPAKTS